MKSINVSSANEIGELFAGTLAEVIHTVSGFELDVSESKQNEGFGELVGIMSFTGNSRGMLFISISERDMRTLCSYITGTAAGDLEMSDIEDSLCEIVNMTAGSAKLQLTNKDYLYLLPWSFIVKGMEVTIAAKNKTPVASRLLKSSEISIGVKVIVDITGTGNMKV